MKEIVFVKQIDLTLFDLDLSKRVGIIKVKESQRQLTLWKMGEMKCVSAIVLHSIF